MGSSLTLYISNSSGFGVCLTVIWQAMGDVPSVEGVGSFCSRIASSTSTLGSPGVPGVLQN